MPIMPAVAYTHVKKCSEIFPYVGLGLAYAEMFELKNRNMLQLA